MTTFPSDYEIVVSTDSHTLWVNADDGSCLARFSTKFGMDIHNSATDQIENNMPQCLYCTHGKTNIEDWNMFRRKMKEIYNIDIHQDEIYFDI